MPGPLRVSTRAPIELKLRVVVDRDRRGLALREASREGGVVRREDDLPVVRASVARGDLEGRVVGNDRRPQGRRGDRSVRLVGVYNCAVAGTRVEVNGH